MMRAMRVVLAAACSLVASACGNDSVGTVEIDGYSFRVPKEYLVEETIPWLPVSHSPGMIFILNPRAQLENQNFVVVEPASAECRGTPPESNALPSACAAAADNRNWPPLDVGQRPEKVLWPGATNFWSYRLARDDGMERGLDVASCGRTLCQSIGNYKNLIYSVGFRDSDVARLPELHAAVRNLLSDWEQ